MPSFQKIVQTLTNQPRIIYSFGLGILVTIILSGGLSSTALATGPAVPTGLSASTADADVVIDGRPIFQLQPFEQFTARQRAKAVNRQLAVLTKSEKEITVEAGEHNQQPIILANGAYLLTVTDLDAILENTSEEQAQEWAQQLERSLRQAHLERTPRYLKKAAWSAGFALLAGIVLHGLFGRFRQHSLKRMLKKAFPSIPSEEIPGAQNFSFAMKLMLVLIKLIMWLSIAWYILSLFPDLRQQRYNLINRSVATIEAPLFSLGGQYYGIIDILILLGLFWGLFTLVQASARVLQNQVLQRTHLARGPKEIFTQAYRYGAFIIGSLVLLQTWGIDLRSITLLGSALGIGIGFGLQDIAKNFGSGLVLLFERSVQVGDFIEIDSHMGVVERIGARSITLRNLDNISILVPNAYLIDSRVVNWDHGHPVSRLHLAVGIAYGSELKTVKSVLLQAAEEHAEVLKKPAPNVYLKEFGNSSVEFDLMVWVRKPELQFEIRSDLYFRIEEILTEHNISIPYPQHDLHLRSGSLPVEFSPDVTEAFLKAFNATKAIKDIGFPREE